MEQKQKKTHSHGGHRQRLRNKALAAGISHWPEHEVLELILTYAIPQKDVNPLAHDLIECFGSLAGVLDTPPNELVKINGIKDHAATFLALLPKFYEYYIHSKENNTIFLNNIHQAIKYFKKINKDNIFEEFYVFCLDNKNKLIKTIHINGMKTASIDVPLKDFSNAILMKECKAIVILHTHPGGNCSPTNADVEATKRLINSAYTVGVDIIDHLIVCDNMYYSFSKNRLLDRLKAEVLNKTFTDITYTSIINKIEE